MFPHQNVLMLSADLFRQKHSVTKKTDEGLVIRWKKLRNRHKSHNSRHKGRKFWCFSFDLWRLDAGKIVLFKVTRHKIHLWTWFLAGMTKFSISLWLKSQKAWLTVFVFVFALHLIQFCTVGAQQSLANCTAIPPAREFHRYNMWIDISISITI